MALRRDFVSQTTSNQHGFDAPDDTFIVIRVGFPLFTMKKSGPMSFQTLAVPTLNYGVSSYMWFPPVYYTLGTSRSRCPPDAEVCKSSSKFGSMHDREHDHTTDLISLSLNLAFSQ